MKTKILLLVLIGMLSNSIVYAQDNNDGRNVDAPEVTTEGDLEHYQRKDIFKNSGLFTRIPAYTGRYLLLGPGCIVYFPFVPFAIRSLNIGEISKTSYKTSDISFGYLGEIALGFPFFLIETLFYDFPCFMFSKPEQQSAEK